MNERSALRPLFLAVVLLDQAVKAAASLLLAPGEMVQLFPGLMYASIEAPLTNVIPERLRIVLVVLLVTLAAMRLQRRESRADEDEPLGLLLIAAGVTSAVVDLLWLRGQIGLFGLQFPQARLLFSVSDLAVVGGVAVFAAQLLRRNRVAAAPPENLRMPQSLHVDLSDLHRGIDNIRVDVRISPQFHAVIKRLVTSIYMPQIWWESWRSMQAKPNVRDLDELRSVYLSMMELSAQRAKQEHQPMLVSLTQLAVIKFVLNYSERFFDRQVLAFRRDLDRPRQRSTRSLAQLRQHLISVRKHRARIIEQANQLMLSQLQRVEIGPVREMRQSLLGAHESLPPATFGNVILHTPDAHDDEFLIRNYLLLGHRSEDASNPSRLEQLLRGLLDCQGEEEGETEVETDAVAPVQVRRRRERCAWLDVPENADQLFDLKATAEHLQRAKRSDDAEEANRQQALLRYQEELLERLERELRKQDVLGMILAAYVLPDLLQVLDLPVSPRLLQRYLAHPGERAGIAARLRKLDRGGDRGGNVQRLDEAAQRISALNKYERWQYLHRFARDFLAYRRDVKSARLLRRWMDQIRLLMDEENIRLSRANSSLHELLCAEDREQRPEPEVIGHAVIKADLRGSTTMTAELLERGLNPATHFEVNFFEPIRNLVELYGAEKVFVEGDAIILAIKEEPEAKGGALCVARACGIARSILEVVATHNLTGEKYGLPSLELGVGIAYEAGAPTYLFDDDRPVMISPAIARADRLSSCASFLRHAELGLGRNRLQVYQAGAQSQAFDKKGSTTFRYNVNGIEIEPTAFARLREEIHLTQRHHRADSEQIFHRGSYTDARGVLRNLLVREGRIANYDRRRGAVDPTDEAFYEVVVDAELLREWVLETDENERGTDSD